MIAASAVSAYQSAPIRGASDADAPSAWASHVVLYWYGCRTSAAAWIGSVVAYIRQRSGPNAATEAATRTATPIASGTRVLGATRK